ncbi:myosin-binding protein 7-like [Impatiens glandulifera]|uniref:myosin-binding protein 7-like n=1 Tax=Impatiens glandulifera TaxID=253017 RepID=UPI001FB04B67|nr:myosin-binding protein 7-like [Impatiens glandulifera]
MDSERLPPRPASSTVRCYDGGGNGGGGVADGSCSLLMHRSYSGTWLRSVERKHYEFNEGNDATISIGDLTFQNVPRIEIENECIALRDMITTQQQSMRNLSVELEAERNASSSAANEAMSMILRLQREKAEVMMENRQFKRYADEKIAHDQQKISAIEELLYKKDQAIQSLSNEVQFYKHRMLSYGLIESESDGDSVPPQFEFPPIYDYPPLKCNKVNQHHVYPEIDYDILDLEYRINQLEKSPRTIHPDGSPRNPRHFRRISTGSPSSVIASSESPRLMTHMRKMENASDLGDDFTSDRIYTIDNGYSETKHVHNNDNDNDFDDECTNTSIDDQEIKKLYMRLYALEADRESMRQAIISMRADDEQFVLLKEIAENLYKDKLPVTRNMIIPVKKKQSLLKRFSFISIFFKWIFSFIFGRKLELRCKYFFGISASSVGLLMLLEKGCRVGRRRYLPSNTNP